MQSDYVHIPPQREVRWREKRCRLLDTWLKPAVSRALLSNTVNSLRLRSYSGTAFDIFVSSECVLLVQYVVEEESQSLFPAVYSIILVEHAASREACY